MSAPRADRAVVLMGHGSPRPAWRRPLDALTEALGGSEAGVYLAFMDHCAPSLAEVASACFGAGINHLSVLPLFISSGGHVNREIRQQTAAVGAAHPELTVVTLPALGELDGVKAALSAVIAAQIGGR